ncbi:MAG: rod-binding protein [Gemmatimonadales bacterium]
MSAPTKPINGAAPPVVKMDREHTKLHKAAQDLEGIFIGELFKAMRATVPDDGILSQAPGQDLFQGMMDDRMAALQAQRSKSGLSESLYRQLSRRLPDVSQP